jgi:ABC-type nitrate/sulfonate/bicarbonate transport system substrate-binding protein
MREGIAMYKRQRRRSLAPGAVTLGLALVLAACGGSGSPAASAGSSNGEVTELTIAIPGSGIAFYGWYAAEALGYWEEEGLDVSLQSTGGSGESSQLLAGGSVDMAEASADTLLQVMRETDVYPFYNFWETEFRRWVVPVDSDIQGISDLAGTTVGVTEMAGGEVPLVRAILASEGLLEDVEIVAVSNEGAAVLAAFEQDRIQSYAGETQTLIAMAAAGVDTRSILPEGLERGPIVPTAASAEFADRQDVMAGVARGIAKGSLFCLSNIEACLDVIQEEHPEFVEDRELALTTLQGYFDITAPEPQDGKYVFGTTNSLEGWQLFVETYSQGPDPLIEDPDAYDLESLVVEIVDEINDFDYDAVVEAAENWEG